MGIASLKKRESKHCKCCGTRMLYVEYGSRYVCDECIVVNERRHNGWSNPYSATYRVLVAANDNDPTSKVCTMCECDLPLSDFTRGKSGLYGCSSECKDCRAAIRGDRTAEYKKRVRPDQKPRLKAKRLRKIERFNRSRIKERRDVGRMIGAYLTSWVRDDRKRKEVAAKIAAKAAKIAECPWLAADLTPYERYKVRVANDNEFAVNDRLQRRLKEQTRLRRRGRCGEAAKAIRRAVRGAGSLPKFLGYTSDDLRVHLESLFTDGMSWEAFHRGDIHVDHKTPLAHFDLTDDNQVREAWALNNLQPLWAADNIAKGAMTDEEWRASASVAA